MIWFRSANSHTGPQLHRKNGAQVFSLLALANLYLARRTLASA